ncbi:DNA-binding response regulator [Xylanibacillus composti]|uniref:DNA-binding response regulator n=1 Tax=Xylanibacillus composti TaxID=1572762 RepID=A0A8J4H655_9BACL|nr:DNA-binding response regulator [Xylanibacillus composti]
MILGTTILIVQENPEWLKLLTAFLNDEHDFLIVGAVTSHQQAMRAAKAILPDIVVMDVQMKDGSWEEGVQAIAEMTSMTDSKAVKALVFSALRDEHVIQQCFLAGALHYTYTDSFRDLPHIIRSCFRSNSPMEVLLKDYLRLKREERLKVLTAAERTIFELVREGMTLADISRKLMKSERTLKNQVNSMLKKLQARSCKEAISKLERMEETPVLQEIH